MLSGFDGILLYMILAERVLFLRMPQTTIRLFGLGEISELEIHQFPIKSFRRPEWDDSPEIELININKMLLNAIGKSVIEVPNSLEDLEAGTKETILDYSILHNGYLDTNLAQSRANVSIMPYSSFDFSPLLLDLKLRPQELIRCYKRSRKLLDYAQITKFYDWPSIGKNGSEKYLPWFWKSVSLNSEIALERIRIAASELSSKSSILDCFLRTENPLLVLISNPIQQANMRDFLRFEIGKNRKLAEWIKKKKPTIFIKLHSWLGGIQTDEFEVQGCTVKTLNNNFDRSIPAEVFIFGNQNCAIAAHVGSSIFSVESSRLIPLIESKHKKSIYSYQLTGARRMKRDKNFPWQNLELGSNS